MRTRSIQIGDVLREHGAKVVFAQDDDVMETLASDAAEESFADNRKPSLCQWTTVSGFTRRMVFRQFRRRLSMIASVEGTALPSRGRGVHRRGTDERTLTTVWVDLLAIEAGLLSHHSLPLDSGTRIACCLFVVRGQHRPDAFDVDLGLSCPFHGRASLSRAVLGHRDQQVPPFLEHSQRDPERLFDPIRLLCKEDLGSVGVPSVAAISKRVLLSHLPQNASATRAVERDLFSERLHCT